MRFTLYSVALLHVAQECMAVNLETQPLEQNLAQTETGNGNLVEALSKVISSLSTNPPAESNVSDDKKAEEGGAGKTGGAGTNIAITTATDQHINIFVPENPTSKVTVKKTNGVKIVESDSDNCGANDATKKALMAKVKTSLSKAAVKGDTSESSDSASDKDGAIKRMENKIKAAKKKSAEMATKLKSASGKSKGKDAKGKSSKAQVAASPMTEAEIMALTSTAQTNAEDDFA